MNGVRNSDVAENSFFPVRSVRVGAIKATFNRVVQGSATPGTRATNGTLGDLTLFRNRCSLQLLSSDA